MEFLNNNMHEPLSSSVVMTHGIIAIFGAVVHAAQSHRNGHSKTFLDFIVLTLMSSFSGAMFALIGLQFFSEQVYFTMAMAGTGGYLGVEGMTIIVNMVKDTISKK